MEEALKFTIQHKPFSINAWTYSDKRHKTKEAKEWQASLVLALEPYAKELREMAEDWRKSGGCFKVSYTAIYPPHIFLNKGKQISSKTIDITNHEKVLQDVIFGDIMSINDKSVIECVSKKVIGPLYALEISIEYFQFVPDE